MKSGFSRYLGAIALLFAITTGGHTAALDELKMTAGTAAAVPQKSFSMPAAAVTQTSIPARSVTTTVSEHLVMGNPSNASTSDKDNYMLVKPEYVVSYNSDKGTPNWVAWHLNSSWLGAAKRSDDFRADTTLPAGMTQITPDPYKASGFDKGHMCNSEDRSNTQAANSETFLMTNMIPQAPKNNEQTWGSLEEYSRTLAKAGDELFIYSGPAGQGGEGSKGQSNTLTAGSLSVMVPAYTWKVILVLPSGATSPSQVTANAAVIAVIMPNNQEISTDWKTYIVTVNDVEKLTNLTFFTTLNQSVASTLKQSKYSGN